ncbi:MAG: NAD(+) synthase, partial [Clostridia bacterium]|nr:NAD(+) synthase [Clostridia bacterium]
IGQDPQKTDITYENSQARERTQILMDIANQQGAIVIGTGDLSELVLGWCTYGGDQMSMYGVNASIPKTLVRYLVNYFATQSENKAVSNTLFDILDTPVSPELLPPDEHGQIAQKTEDHVGPYDLHDFFIYYALRYGFSPAKIYRMCLAAWGDVYDEQTIKKWLKTFYRRFFSQQFKRSCMPDGVAVGKISLSPRTGLKMPSDACATLWIGEAAGL